MKKTIVALVLTIFTSLYLFAKDKIQTVDVKTKITCDHCMLCGTCGARIEKVLYDKKGIKRVDVDDKTHLIKVVYNTEKISLAEIRNMIAANGYDADDVKAPAEAVAKLDGCCKGEE
jgi:mercuric ion binding protein